MWNVVFCKRDLCVQDLSEFSWSSSCTSATQHFGPWFTCGLAAFPTVSDHCVPTFCCLLCLNFFILFFPPFTWSYSLPCSFHCSWNLFWHILVLHSFDLIRLSWRGCINFISFRCFMSFISSCVFVLHFSSNTGPVIFITAFFPNILNALASVLIVLVSDTQISMRRISVLYTVF